MMADHLILERNSPNPFEDQTMITFQIPAAAHVELTALNNRRQQIRKVLDTDCDVGRYTVPWDGRSDRGEVVPSGVYFYRLKAGGIIEERLCQEISISIRTDVVPSIARPIQNRSYVRVRSSR